MFDNLNIFQPLRCVHESAHKILDMIAYKVNGNMCVGVNRSVFARVSANWNKHISTHIENVSIWAKHLGLLRGETWIYEYKKRKENDTHENIQTFQLGY